MRAKRSATSSPRLPVEDDIARLIDVRSALIDVRAPIEFEKGAVPNAVNLPILDNAERAQVGTTYKSRGREAAKALGHGLVDATHRASRIDAWRTFATSAENVRIYCARGGLRSRIAQQWLAETGIVVPRVAGGFKAIRRACLHVLAHRSPELNPVVLGGRTGAGKTEIIKSHRHLDLEALANHRGSAFGANSSPQPSTINFENALAYELTRLEPGFLVEDESRKIGRLSIPEPFFAAMRRAPVIVVEAPLDERVNNIRREYVEEARPPAATMRAALARIQRRLGRERFEEIDSLMKNAFDADDPALHNAWIERLLTGYYDPMYAYQLEKKADRIVFSGNRDGVDEYVSERLAQARNVAG